MLGMLSTQTMPDTGYHSASVVHLMAEVERRSFADRSVHMADPDFWNVPSDSLVNPAYLRARMAGFDPEKATPSKNVKAGAFKVSEQTTHFNVVDMEGNAVSITTTLNDSYGSRVVVGGGGFILNNEMDDFSAKPGAPNLYGAIGGKGNAVAPNKRPLSSMTPTIVTRNGKLSMVLGTPGGTTIPTSVFQILVDTYWFKMPLSESVHSGRFHHQWSPDKIVYEEDKPLSQQVIEQLEAMGHTVESRSPIGRVEAIVVTPAGKLNGVADDRGDDSAGGY
jgi:gamma-glutamyltranspeptidase / glutathione hydrolase